MIRNIIEEIEKNAAAESGKDSGSDSGKTRIRC